MRLASFVLMGLIRLMMFNEGIYIQHREKLHKSEHK